MLAKNSPSAYSVLSSSLSLKRLFATMSVTKRAREHIIIYENDDVSRIYCIKSGYVKLTYITETGDERILVILKPGDIFPNYPDPSVRSYTSPYSYVAMTNIEIGSLPAATFLDEVQSNKASTWAMLHYVSNCNEQITRRLAQLEGSTVEFKLTQLLHYLVTTCGDRQKQYVYKFKLKLTHQDIADLLGVARETASKEVQKLVKSSVISHDDGYMVFHSNRLKV